MSHSVMPLTSSVYRIVRSAYRNGLLPTKGLPLHDYLVSFPRSGNHWVRFCIEYLSGRPTLGCASNNHDLPIYLNTFPNNARVLTHVAHRAKPIIRKAHFACEIAKPDSLLLIVRDPKECIPRHSNEDSGLFAKLIREYLLLLEYYQQQSCRKAMLYYEDLLLDPNASLRVIHEHIGRPSNERLELLLANHDDFRVLSIEAKGRAWKGAVSGFESEYHWRRLSETSKTVFREEWNRRNESPNALLSRYSSP